MKIEFAERNGKPAVVVHENGIRQELQNKLCEQNTTEAMAIGNTMAGWRSLQLGMLTSKKCGECRELSLSYPEKKERGIENLPHKYKSIPYGSINSEVMFVKKMPSLLEASTMLSHSDTSGHFLMFVLKKLGFNPEEFYFTDFIKCPDCMADNEICWQCISSYFLMELMYLAPKVLITEGTSILRFLGINGVFPGIPDVVQYGQQYKTNFMGHEFTASAIYNPDEILKRDGERLDAAKNGLWICLNIALKEQIEEKRRKNGKNENTGQ